MPDLFDNGQDEGFWETMGQPDPEPDAPTETVDTAESPATDEAPADLADTADEQTQPDRLRDEKGRFVPSRIEVDDPRIASYLDKYGGDPVKALEAAVEAQQTIGRQSSDVGELRRQVDQLTQLIQSQQQPQHAPYVDYQAEIENSPSRAAQLAYQNGDGNALRAALSAWEDVAPGAPELWAQNLQLQEQMQQLSQTVQQHQGSIAQSSEQQAMRTGMGGLLQAEPDLFDRIQRNADRIPQEVAATLYAVLESGTPEHKIGAFRALSELTRDQPQADTLVDQARNIVREQANEAERAIAEASVVSSQAQKTEAPKNAAQLIGDEWDRDERSRSEGWMTRR